MTYFALIIMQKNFLLFFLIADTLFVIKNGCKFRKLLEAKNSVENTMQFHLEYKNS